MSEWQPIETAPRDGTPVLIYQPEYEDGGENARWRQSEHYPSLPAGGFGGAIPYDDKRYAIGYWRPWGGWGNRNSARVNPSHWMPLPTLPEVMRPRSPNDDWEEDIRRAQRIYHHAFVAIGRADFRRPPPATPRDAASARAFYEVLKDFSERRLSPRPSRRADGTWPERCEQRAFVDGAKWWEFISTGGTMWASDQRSAEQEAVRRYGAPVTSEPGQQPPEDRE